MSKPTGPGNPPVASRFPKGRSGNPKGRPRAEKKTSPGSAFDIVIDRTLTVTQGGTPREVTVDEALQHRTYQDAIAGSRLARREVLKMIAKREQYLAAQHGKKRAFRRSRTRIEPHDPENADAALLILGIATRDPRTEATALDGLHLLLEPWAVQAALRRRRGGQRLSEKEVSDIERCTRDAGVVALAAGHPRMTDGPDGEDAVGYRRPPESSRFRKGQSGNPRGRPRGRHRAPPYEAVLGQMVTIREDGVERRVTAAEAFLLQITKKGLEGDGAAARAAMAAIEEARASRLAREPQEKLTITTGHRPTGQRQQRARAAAHGSEARPLPRHRENGARALARRSRPRPARRSAADAR